MERVDPPYAADEKTMLTAFLDYQRATMVRKAEGLTDAQARWSPVGSGTSLFGLLAHLVAVERWWFVKVVAGEDVALPWSREDPDADWRGAEYATLADVVAAYEQACARSNEIARATDLDATGHPPRPLVTLRWVLVHMVEETARHAGHADIVREQLDGVVGE